MDAVAVPTTTMTAEALRKILKATEEDLTVARQMVTELEEKVARTQTLLKALMLWEEIFSPPKTREEEIAPRKRMNKATISPTAQLVLEALTHRCDEKRPNTMEELVVTTRMLFNEKEKPPMKLLPTRAIRQSPAPLIRALHFEQQNPGYIPQNLILRISACFGPTGLEEVIKRLRILQSGGTIGATVTVTDGHRVLSERDLPED